ncbi:MAG: MoaD/ThiS family protein [Oscillospiraceae bacterium]|nr:MoaD/ThiS family protein [Oscillospiraceae bacterium]
MVTVRVFGVLRLESGVKRLEADADRVQDVFRLVYEEIKRVKPEADISLKDVRSCVVTVNGKIVKNSTRLKDGDEVMLVPSSCGG